MEERDGVLTYTANTDTIAWSANSGQANQNAFSIISVSGQSNVEADEASDTVSFAAGNAITIVTAAGTDTVTFAVTDGEIDTAELADAAVTTAKIDAAAVTFAKLAPAAVTTEAEGIANADNDTSSY